MNKPKTIPIADLLIEVADLEARRLVAARVRAIIAALDAYQAKLSHPGKRRAA